MDSVFRVSDDSVASAAVFCASTPVPSSLPCRFLSSPDSQQEDRSPREYQAARRGCLQCRRRAYAQTSHAGIDREAPRRAPLDREHHSAFLNEERASDDPRVAGNERRLNSRSRSYALRSRSRYNIGREALAHIPADTSRTTSVALRRTHVHLL